VKSSLEKARAAKEHGGIFNGCKFYIKEVQNGTDKRWPVEEEIASIITAAAGGVLASEPAVRRSSNR
jgi:hypothetical protein